MLFRIFIISFLLIISLPAQGQLTVEKLWVENCNNPIGITTKSPRFTWIIVSNRRGTHQAAYEVRVARDQDDLRRGKDLVWESGRVASDQSVHIPFTGNALKSAQTYYWQVRVWDRDNRASRWSETGTWQMGASRSGERIPG